MFRNLRLAVKIGGGFGIILVFSAITCVITLNGLSSISGSVSRSEIAHAIVENTQNAMVSGKNFVITKDGAHIANVSEKMDKNVVLAKELQPQVRDKGNLARLDDIIKGSTGYKTEFNAYADCETQKKDVAAEMEKQALRIAEDIARLRKMTGNDMTNATLRNLLQNVLIDDLSYEQEATAENILKLQDDAAELSSYARAQSSAAKSIDAQEILSEIASLASKYTETSRGYEKIVTRQLQAQANAVAASTLAVTKATELSQSGITLINSTERNIRAMVILFSLASLSLGLCLALFLTKTITGAMSKGVAFAEKMSAGDLTAQTGIRQNDEIGKLAASLDAMKDKLKAIVDQIQAAALQVGSGSQQLSSTAQEMSQGATEQASSLEEISSSMEEMTSNIRQNAENAMQTGKISLKSAQIAEEGGKAVNDTVEAMRMIATKISIIEEIARSTNMLALNASIEAARAGEYGKGFAVVASEVGKLAERSAKEAGEISKLSGESVQIAERAGQTINSMIPEIKRTAELVQEISAASSEQNSGAEQINSALMQLDQVVQQNASASEESASMSEELAGQAEQMQETISFFKLDGSSKTSKKTGAKSAFEETLRSTAPTTKQKNPTALGRVDLTRRPKGVHIDLDDESAHAPGKDEIDGDYQRF